MSVNDIKTLFEKYHISELTGIAVSFIMAVISFIPILVTYNLHQLCLSLSFLIIFIIKLALFIWNRKISGKDNEKIEQAKMMLVSSIILLLMHSTIMIAVIYQLFENENTPLMASLIILAMVYGVYAFSKLIMSVYNLYKKRKTNLYYETLANLG